MFLIYVCFPSYTGDPVEGTSVWLDPKEYGYKDSKGVLKFSGYNALCEHSCDPNIVYKQTKQTEQNNWQYAFAARDISKGEILKTDYNSFCWDRSGLKIVTCDCGSQGCTGTVKGFKFLSNIQQKKKIVDCDNGRWLSPHVREEYKTYDMSLFDYDSGRMSSMNNRESRDSVETRSLDFDPRALYARSKTTTLVRSGNCRSVPAFMNSKASTSCRSGMTHSVPTSMNSSLTYERPQSQSFRSWKARRQYVRKGELF